ncbi:hypothetical protein [Liquorilactobacillus mali]|uniref:Uncharacterized protein n=1 Tax=Liquorilactobacillus mali KCTC 3596 = DSM 20444 TaxID=1046596 RepID=A0A0R2EE22_9LACO|nr:hypothetical protein [Liquorilactobacillus mali]KRN10796.1 hypothetical protein FD00_GL002038 [Liquorilactobacillus mali KCTC 3596 = DSM 20444]
MKKEKLLESVKLIKKLTNIIQDTNSEQYSINLVKKTRQELSHRLDRLAIKELMKEADVDKKLYNSRKFYDYLFHELEEANYHYPAEALLNLDKDVVDGYEINANCKDYIYFVKTIAKIVLIGGE